MFFLFFLIFADPSLCLPNIPKRADLAIQTQQAPKKETGNSGQKNKKDNYPYCVGEWCDPSHEPYPNIVSVMTGYDILKGNPFTTSQSVDPGFSTGYIFSPIERTSDGTYALNSGVTVRKTLQCTLTSGTDTITTLDKYIKSIRSKSSQGITFTSNLETKVTVEGEVAGVKGGKETTIPPLLDAAYSSSSEYKNNQKFFTEKKGVMTLRDATCATYTVQISPFSPPPFSDGFKKALYDLNEVNKQKDNKQTSTFNKTASVNGVYPTGAGVNDVGATEDAGGNPKKKIFQRFVTEFGTHFLHQTTMGARTAITRRYSQDEYKKSTDDEIQNCSEDRLKLTVAGVGLGRTSDSCKNIDSLSSNFNGKEFEKESITSYGSKPADSLTEWSKQDFESPLPIKMELRPITELFSDSYMSKFTDISYKDILKWLQILYDNYCNDYKELLGIASCHPNKLKKCGLNDDCDPREDFCIDIPDITDTINPLPTPNHKRKNNKKKEQSTSAKKTTSTVKTKIDCQKRPCLSNPCKNLGLCKDILKDAKPNYLCECTMGWDGLTCEDPIDKFEAISEEIKNKEGDATYGPMINSVLVNELYNHLSKKYTHFNFAVNAFNEYDENDVNVHSTMGDKYFKSFNKNKRSLIVGFSKKQSKVPTKEHLQKIQTLLDSAMWNSKTTIDDTQKAVNKMYEAFKGSEFGSEYPFVFVQAVRNGYGLESKCEKPSCLHFATQTYGTVRWYYITILFGFM